MSNFQVSENTPVGTLVYKLKGQDPEGSRVLFYMSGDTFSVERETGLVTLIKPLDREVDPVLDLIITLIDEKSNGKPANTVSLVREVKVSDANDNSPVFSRATFDLIVSEATKPFTTFFEGLFVTDADAGANAQVTLECARNVTPDACETFHVNVGQLAEGRYRGAISLKAKQLDYETTQSYRMVLVARDRGGLTASVEVTVNVQDVQDEAPRFLNAPLLGDSKRVDAN